MSGGSLEKVPQQGPRVKVYVLGEFSDWEDFGVGFLEFKHEFNAETEQTDDFLTVRSERKTYSHQPLYPKRDREWLLYSKLDISNDYEKQEGTIIRWRDGELREELAISFTDKDKCDEQWRILCEHIGKDHLEIANLRSEDQMQMPTQDNLVYIMNTATNRPTAVCFHIINGTQFLSRLTSLANQFQSSNNIEGLKFLSRIVKVILSYHDTRIIEILFSSSFFETLLKVLKYSEANANRMDYAHQYQERFKHRSLIHFDEVNNERILTINRIMFYIETILNLTTEQNLEAYLIRTINGNFSEVFRMMVCTRKFSELVAQSRKDLGKVLAFLSELLVDLKAYSQGHEDVRIKIFGSFFDQGLTHTLAEAAFQKLQESQMVNLLEILSVISLQSQRQFYDYIKATLNNETNLPKVLARQILGPSTDTRRASVSLIRPFFTENSNTCKKEFAELFVASTLHIVAEAVGKGELRSYCSMMELILIIIQNTECPTGKLFLKNGLLRVMKQCATRKEEQLMTIQLLKLVLSKKDFGDTELLQEIIKEDLMGWAIRLFGRIHRQNNLISSALLECFQLLAVRKQKSFLSAVLEYKSLLPTGIPTIAKLLNSLEQHEKQSEVDKKYMEMLENEKEEKYLTAEEATEKVDKPFKKEIEQDGHIQSLRSLAEEIGRKNLDEEEPQLKKVHRQQPPPPTDQKVDQFVFNFQIQSENQENNSPS